MDDIYIPAPLKLTTTDSICKAFGADSYIASAGEAYYWHFSYRDPNAAESAFAEIAQALFERFDEHGTYSIEDVVFEDTCSFSPDYNPPDTYIGVPINSQVDRFYIDANIVALENKIIAERVCIGMMHLGDLSVVGGNYDRYSIDLLADEQAAEDHPYLEPRCFNREGIL